MRWEDERYVRIYTRDTADWLCLSFLAQGLFCLLLRKVDRAGLLPLGRAGRKGAAIAVGHAHEWPKLEQALDELLADGCVQINGDVLVIPNFIEAQEAEASDKARAKKHREKVRDLARTGCVTQNSESASYVTDPSQDVTAASRGVTKRHAEMEIAEVRDETVTPNRAVPNRAVLPVPSQPAVSGNGTDHGTAAGRQEAGQEAETGATELLRVTLQQRLGRHIGGCGRNADTVKALTRQIDALGFEKAVQASLEVADVLERKGDPLRSLAALPGWLETVVATVLLASKEIS